ncbi:outer membrane lipoprotein carrier protein LolA [uncultured Sunxiuqinia sp.]|uniref:LolA family protein n=1 Tax=uncultured Sunxiuqinia sp. TaxID=1573825 RepID=UPI00261D4398|nr:outer membrane lipoprotein carrier protein LolA [uncultured Sunxiuqinia sp.]
MKRLVVLMTVMVFWSVGFAQQDKKAKDILEKVTSTTQSYSSISASFNYVMNNEAEGIHEENKGQILLKGQQFHLKLLQLGMEIFNNGKTVWTYMKDAGEVTVAEADDEMNEMMDPSTLFTIYEKGFNYQFVEEKTVAGVPVYIIDLFPENEEIEYSKIRIQVDKQRMLIRQAEMVGKEGNSYLVLVEDLKTNVPVKDSDFEFKTEDHPGVEVIDLR